MMFTGIVAAVGCIKSIRLLGSSANAGARLTIDVGGLDITDLQIGNSIAIQGACMTMIEKTTCTFDVDISRESLNCTVGLSVKDEINLEKALRAHDRLGGHIVLGHIDGLGTVTRFRQVGESHELCVLASRKIGRYLVYKGSIAVNGVSLTVNSVKDCIEGCEFSINLVPHTVKVTTLKQLKPGKQVNLEVDLIARYVERILLRLEHLHPVD